MSSSPRTLNENANITNSNNDNEEGIIIENISAINIDTTSASPTAAGAGAVVVEGDADEDDNLSLSAATSATSVASALSDGEPRPRSTPRPRMRSASFNIPASSDNFGFDGVGITGRPGSTPRQRSTPRSRPRSNPRTRTPMRNPSPLLVTGRVLDENNVIASDAQVDEAAASTSVVANNDEHENEAVVRNIFGGARRHRSRAGSIPEEAEEIANESSAPPVARSVPRAGNWLARAAANTTANTRSANPSRSRRNPAVGPSHKQGPSHRKLRRWNNDRFVGTSSEHTHIVLESEGGGEDNWKEHFMPNYPCEYRSEFARLSKDESKRGKGVRERFLKGEVGHRPKGDTKNEGEFECIVSAKFHKLGLSVSSSATNNSIRQDESEMGERLFRSLNSRIRSVVTRSCTTLTDCDGSNSSPSFAARAVAAFESYLVSLALAGSKNDVTSSEGHGHGYPPLQSEGVYEILGQLLAGPPKVVIRKKTHRNYSSSSNNTKKCDRAVLVPAVHFYFPEDGGSGYGNHNGSGNGNGGSNGNEGQVKSSAFYRILLYAVCGFHGLEASSSIIDPNFKRGKNQSRRGSSSSNGGRKEGETKVVTVQGGILLAPTLKLLDYVE